MAARIRANKNGDDAAASVSSSEAAAARRTRLPASSNSLILWLFNLNIFGLPAALCRVHEPRRLRKTESYRNSTLVFAYLCLQIALHDPSQMRPRAMCSHLYFGNRPVSYLGDFRHGKALDVEQRQHEAIICAQPRQQLDRQVARHEIRLDVLRRRAKLRREFLRFGFLDIAEALLRTSPHAAQLIV